MKILDLQKTKRAKSYGQFFTPEHVACFMVSLITKNKDSLIIEPSCGEGAFLRALQKKNFNNLLGYEVDSLIIKKTDTKIVKNESFLKHKRDKGCDVVIGNPPYVRWKNLDEKLKTELTTNKVWNTVFNNLCDYLYIFIYQAIETLNDGGELIFITPEYWFNTKHSQPLRNHLLANGYFEKIFHFNETPIFEKVTSSIIIFKYVKQKLQKPKYISVWKYKGYKRLQYSDLNNMLNLHETENTDKFQRDQFKKDCLWLLIPNKVENELKRLEAKCSPVIEDQLIPDETKYAKLSDIADIGNGMVSGLDKAFQLAKDSHLDKKELLLTIPVIKAKHLKQFYYLDTTNYIFINKKVSSENELKDFYPNFFNKLQPFKKELNERYKYSTKLNYWDWAFPRSLNLFCKAESSIFVPCKERISHKKYFRFCYVEAGYFPTQDVTSIVLKKETRESIFYVLGYLNSEIVFSWLIEKGVRKGNIIEFSEKPLASIPIKRINWHNKEEIKMHNDVAEIAAKIIKTKDLSLIQEVNKTLHKYFL
jgi:adenine-specific DNA-methyltransferase